MTRVTQNTTRHHRENNGLSINLSTKMRKPKGARKTLKGGGNRAKGERRESASAEMAQPKRQADKRRGRVKSNMQPHKSFSKATLADAARSGLDAYDFDRMGIVDRVAAWNDTEHGIPRAGYEIPYHDLDGKPYSPPFARTRFTEFQGDVEHNGRKIHNISELRYTQKAGTGVRPYLCPTVNWRDVLADPSIPVIITEGEKKSAKACREGFFTVGLGGVWNFRHNGIFLEELKLLAAGGRRVYICFDSDRLKKSGEKAASVDNKKTGDKKPKQLILQAETTLAMELRRIGARVFIVQLAQIGEKKVGMDDVLVQKGGCKLLKTALDAATEHTLRHTIKGIRDFSKSNEARHQLVAEMIVSDLCAHGRFIRTPASLLYYDAEQKILVPLDDRNSRETRAYIDEKTGVCAAALEWSVTFERLADFAYTHGEQTKVHKLSAWHPERSTLYIAKSASELFEITPDGWRVVDNGAGATDKYAGTLIHTRGKLSNIEVAKRAGRTAFDTLIYVPNFIDGVRLTAKESRMLWSLYCLAIFFPQALPTRPIPLFHGPKGSGKTSGYRAFLRTIYGAEADVTVIDPKKAGGIESVLVHDGVAAIDNVDGSHVELQNALASAATGGTLSMRKLFTTMDQSQFSIDCFLGATSRDPKTFARDDVVDRLLYLLVGRREDGFMKEAELTTMIDSNRSKFWRWLLDTLPAIIKALQIAPGGMMYTSRMADFAGFAAAVAPVLGYTPDAVKAALSAMNAEALQFQMEYSPIVGAIGTYIDTETGRLAWEMHDLDVTEETYNAARDRLMKPMTAAELLHKIKLVTADFPYKDAASFGRAVVNDAAAIGTRYKLTLGNDRTKKRTYRLEPLGGFLTWADQLEALRGG